MLKRAEINVATRTCMRSHVSFKVTGGQKGGLTMFAEKSANSLVSLQMHFEVELLPENVFKMYYVQTCNLLRNLT